MNENKTDENQNPTPPPLFCKGCAARDGIIQSLAAEVDRLNGVRKAKKLKKAA